MKHKLILLLFIVFFCFESSTIFSQTDTIPQIEISADLDLVSRYIWRGQEYGQSPNIQPGLSMTWKNFTFGSWGSYKLTGAGSQETDFFLSKTFNHLTLSVWDYWSFEDTSFIDILDFKEETTGHLLEAQLLISGGDILPFNLLGSYNFYGADPSNSLYFELQYELYTNSFDLIAFLGVQAKGDYYAEKPDVVNLGVTVTKYMKITNSWDLPVSISFIVNPNLRTAYLVAGISF